MREENRGGQVRGIKMEGGKEGQLVVDRGSWNFVLCGGGGGNGVRHGRIQGWRDIGWERSRDMFYWYMYCG